MVNFKTTEAPFTQADVVRLARRALARSHGDIGKAGRYASNMADRYESVKWERVMEYILNTSDAPNTSDALNFARAAGRAGRSWIDLTADPKLGVYRKSNIETLEAAWAAGWYERRTAGLISRLVAQFTGIYAKSWSARSAEDRSILIDSFLLNLVISGQIKHADADDLRTMRANIQAELASQWGLHVDVVSVNDSRNPTVLP